METIINFGNGYGRVIVGQKVEICNTEHVVVGFSDDAIVFANLNPKCLEDARVLMYTENEIDELINNGLLKGYKR